MSVTPMKPMNPESGPPLNPESGPPLVVTNNEVVVIIRETEDEVRLIPREKFEKNLDDTIKNKYYDEISERLDPYQLTKCKMNCLEKSLEVSYKLRKRAHGPDAEDLKKMGAAVEDFAFHLLDPLKNDDDMRSKLKGQDFDRVIDKAVAFKQMKFLSHPVLYTLLKKRWKGKFYKIRSRSPFIWVLLNLFTAVDVSLFLLFFPLLIIAGCINCDPFVRYLEFFTTPYFVFARDTISYLVLLGLHYAVCLQPQNSEPVIEGVILVFFLGRLLMEIDQIMNIKDRRTWDSESGGVKQKQTKWKKLSMRMMSKYLGDWWNLLDALSLVIAFVIFLLWITREKEAFPYLYGINTILLTFRVFGHIMETRKLTGSIQIALFHIIGAVIAISGQFLAVLLAFSFAITKTYLAGNLDSTNTTEDSDSGNDTNKTSEPIDLWKGLFGNLTWSLLGDVNPESVASLQNETNLFAKVLYGIFLIIGGVMLLNMLIALLTNTYQKVENNAFYEWSHKKAITIRTYCSYHPVPVPFNIVSLLFKFLLCRCRRNNQQGNTTGNNDNSQEFIDLIQKLQSKYFSVFGYSFPKTDGEKVNEIAKETKGSRQLMGNVASRVFEYNFEEKQEIARKYKTDRWISRGITIDGQRMSYMDCDCLGCKIYGPKEYNGGVRHEPLLAEWPKFEVLIQECTELRFIAIGLVDKNWKPHIAPGTQGNSVGYHVHKRKIFDKQNQEKGKYVKDSSASRGDVIGCELMYEEKSDDGFPVHFTLNGKVIGHGLLRDEDEDGNPFEFCPFVGIGSEGTTLLFRIQSKEPIPCTNKAKDLEVVKAMGSQEMDALTNLTELLQDTKRSMDNMFKRMKELQQQMDSLKKAVEFSKDQVLNPKDQSQKNT